MCETAANWHAKIVQLKNVILFQSKLNSNYNWIIEKINFCIYLDNGSKRYVHSNILNSRIKNGLGESIKSNRKMPRLGGN